MERYGHMVIGYYRPHVMNARKLAVPTFVDGIGIKLSNLHLDRRLVRSTLHMFSNLRIPVHLRTEIMCCILLHVV